MKHVLLALGALLGAYLWADKFLFGGELARLFLRGWRERFSALTPRRWRHAAAPEPEYAPSEAPDAGELVPRRKYLPTAAVPADASDAKAVSNTEGNATFAVPKGEEPEPEIMECRAPELDRKARPEVPPRMSAATEGRKAPPLWDEMGIGRFIPRDDGTQEGDWIVQYDEEEIRRELQQIEREQFEQQYAQEAPPTANEQLEVEQFDTAAYL